MTPRRRRMLTFAVLAVGLTALTAGGALAQQWWGRRASPRDGIPADRGGVPDWKVDERFKRDVFTFVRAEYGSYGRRGRGGGGGWATDWPDSDLNFSYRLQQLTSLRVEPRPITLRLDDEKLLDYPFVYMIEPGGMVLSEEEVVGLRRYLLNGGFLMVDDFWGDWQYQNFYREIKRVFPDREPEELPLEHPIFQCVYKLKERPQVPSIHTWMGTGQTWEDHGPGSREVHYRGIQDDEGRLMAIICHNTDLGDGWEREGEDPAYFREFAERLSYPMGINIVTYAMTH